MTLQRKLPAFIAGLIAAVAVLGAATSAKAAETINLVAYSTPQDAYKRIIPLFQKTKAGQGREVHAVLRRLGRPVARRRRRAAAQTCSTSRSSPT